MASAKSPRYDADYDALQCSKRNGSACRACANRMAFLGKRGEKGAWNKPCQGTNKPDPSGKGRRRSSYGGQKVDMAALTASALTDDSIRPHTPEPESEPRPSFTVASDPDAILPTAELSQPSPDQAEASPADLSL